MDRDSPAGTLLRLAATIVVAGALVAGLLLPWIGGPAVAAQQSTGLLGDLPTEFTADTPPGNTVLLAAAGLPATVLADDGTAPGRVAVVPATLAKGLEFDAVVVADPAAVVAAEPRGLNRLYVVLTRAVSTLVVLHRDDLPAPLTG